MFKLTKDKRPLSAISGEERQELINYMEGTRDSTGCCYVNFPGSYLIYYALTIQVFQLLRRIEHRGYVRIVEIGTARGMFSLVVAKAIRKYAASFRDVQVVTMDPYDPTISEGVAVSEDHLGHFLRQVRKDGQSDLILPMIGRSDQVSKVWRQPIHFLFVDGDHSAAGVRRDVETWLPHLAPGFPVLLHDYTSLPEVKQEVHSLFKDSDDIKELYYNERVTSGVWGFKEPRYE